MDGRHVQLVTHAPRRQFQRITFGNVFHITCGVVCHLLLGAVNMLVIEYTIKSGDLHALLCTQAWHMYTVEAMFALVFTNAWGSYTNLLLRRVRLIHMVFQIISLLNLLTGTVMIFIATKKRGYYVHGQVGIITLVMFLLTVVVGPTSMISQNNQNIKFFHIGFAVPTFILTSIVNQSMKLNNFPQGTLDEK
ncbi:hypothetical protein NE865_04765 [Phthorimaea operculella]|nr:hypothetical protein NE865_04765 [Phthorimaea operculella]